MADMVNRPAHYNKGDIECLDAIRSALGDDGFKAYCRGASLKYLWRCEYKHPENPGQDIQKAIFYLNRYLESL